MGWWPSSGSDEHSYSAHPLNSMRELTASRSAASSGASKLYSRCCGQRRSLMIVNGTSTRYDLKLWISNPARGAAWTSRPWSSTSVASGDEHPLRARPADLADEARELRLRARVSHCAEHRVPSSPACHRPRLVAWPRRKVVRNGHAPLARSSRPPVRWTCPRGG
jgi:hypothetical protein